MKRSFFFHRINAPMDADHVVYKVWAGESVREQRILAKLVAWSFAHGATLRQWSEDVDFYLDIEAERVFPGRGLLDFGFIRADISVAEAVQLAEGDLFPSYEKTLCQPKGFFRAVELNSPAKIDRENSQIKTSHVLTSPRKNLSERYEHGRFIISFI